MKSSLFLGLERRNVLFLFIIVLIKTVKLKNMIYYNKNDKNHKKVAILATDGTIMTSRGSCVQHGQPDAEHKRKVMCDLRRN